MGKIIVKVVGGLGNQLFMIFNAISLSIDYNLDLIIDSTQYDFKRPPIDSYKIFNSKNLIKKNIDNFGGFNDLEILKQYGFYYIKFNLDVEKNYLLDAENSGYFQSYKFFWHNIEKIKNYISIDNERINYFKSELKKIGKHIAIHFRLTDYIQFSYYHKVVDVDYYKNILSTFDLSEYKIILFSDDVITAKNMLESVVNHNNIILANDYTLDDEDQLFLMACTDIRILPNSSFSLWSCYLNEMYNNNTNSKYYLPSKWFGAYLNSNYNIYDLIPNHNDKYKIINV